MALNFAFCSVTVWDVGDESERTEVVRKRMSSNNCAASGEMSISFTLFTKRVDDCRRGESRWSGYLERIGMGSEAWWE